MTKKKPLETSEEFVNAIADLFDAIGPETPEEIDAVLQEAGYDPDEIAENMQALAEEALRNSPLNWRSRAEQELEAARSGFESSVARLSRTRTELINTIQELIQQVGGQQKQTFAHYRNFEEASDEDLTSMLKELKYLLSKHHDQGTEGES